MTMEGQAHARSYEYLIPVRELQEALLRHVRRTPLPATSARPRCLCVLYLENGHYAHARPTTSLINSP